MDELSQIRVSHSERDQAVEALRGHAADGRLELEELEQRLEAVLAARTRAELAEPLRDLPSAAPHRPRRRVPRPAWLLLAVAVVAGLVFALTGTAGWVMWTALGWALLSYKSGRHACFTPRRRRHSTA